MLLGGLYFFSAFFAIAFFFQRYRWRRRRRQGKSNWGFYPSSASLGNALQELSVMAQPQVEQPQDAGCSYEAALRDVAQRIVYAMSRSLLKNQHFALQKCIALVFRLAIGFRNVPRRTIFDVWCSDPY
jgi:hypothetical protein